MRKEGIENIDILCGFKSLPKDIQTIARRSLQVESQPKHAATTPTTKTKTAAKPKPKPKPKPLTSPRKATRSAKPKQTKLVPTKAAVTKKVFLNTTLNASHIHTCLKNINSKTN